MEKRKEKNSLFTIFTMAMVASLLIIASGCKSTQKSGSTQAVTIKELQTLPALSSSGRHLTAKLKLNVNFKGSKFSASGNIKIKRDEGLQISINALGGLVEVARIEATPEKMLLIYRLGREYAEIKYSEVEVLEQLGIDYTMLEAILMNELFAPNGGSLEKELKNMELRTAGGEIIVTTPREKDMQYSFHIEQSEGRLILTQGNYANRINVSCNYSDFSTIGTRPFPQNITFAVADMSLGMTLSNIKDDSFKLSTTSHLSSYKKVNAGNLLKGLNF
jgi:hypothetical protein